MHSSSRILLFYDGTAEANVALLRCAELALALTAYVDVLTVIDYVEVNRRYTGMLSETAITQIEDLARVGLKDAIDELGMNGVVAYGHVAFGETSEAIVRTIEQLDSDVVVVGHRTRARNARWHPDRPLHVDLAEKLKGSAIITVKSP